MKLSSISLSFASLLAVATADWQYRSRPDLSPPQLNITIPPKDTAPGYLFLAPYSGFADIGTTHGPRQSAPYIFTDKGELVWSGYTYFSIWAANFQAGKVNGKDVLFSFEGSHNPNYGHGHGHITFLDQKYQTVHELRAGNHKLLDKHEFHIINERTGLVEIYDPVPIDLTPYGGTPDQQWIVDAKVQELDIETGEVLFQWSSLEHILPHDSVLPVYEGQPGFGYNSSDAWDYFHINSVDKDENGDYLISARNAASIYKIDGKTGEVIWKLGGLPGVTSSDFSTKDKNLTFSFQHHARYLSTSEDGSRQVISLYDNSAHGTENKDGREKNYKKQSSGKIVEVDTKNWEAKLLFNGPAPDNLLSKSQGSTQVLENGNVLVGWGSEGAVSEFNPKGEAIFHAYVDSGEFGHLAQNYRAFKFDWHGYPTEDIALYSEVTEDGHTIAYVSWNGDTETKSWKFFSVDENGTKHFLEEKKKAGFETLIKFDNKKHSKIIVEAFDHNGKALAASTPVFTQKQILPYKKESSNDQRIEKLEKEVGLLESALNYFDWRTHRSSYGF
ncbi:hypothetical protein HYPBUDRAFT_157883 [Hyphopichia burtonii NRRL Y-1933]|uniref:Arylsulfotransferase n=1 Tax=Hyphopichia burtonii NRRL Y-1933 TaxID=984485 RepID=A0A1E4REY0_9ASCO|nr:hypothetical protein HYPBUDRAFT_157883 [Hyphopichia burtonii NRRL Y-1933]ODV65800.1 hypothetical protein HYPBUDRAFT_157883 [Hyphopichia burtonii NRRL Y-1933]